MRRENTVVSGLPLSPRPSFLLDLTREFRIFYRSLPSPTIKPKANGQTFRWLLERHQPHRNRHHRRGVEAEDPGILVTGFRSQVRRDGKEFS
jgi:hypothetical protein